MPHAPLTLVQQASAPTSSNLALLLYGCAQSLVRFCSGASGAYTERSGRPGQGVHLSVACLKQLPKLFQAAGLQVRQWWALERGAYFHLHLLITWKVNQSPGLSCAQPVSTSTNFRPYRLRTSVPGGALCALVCSRYRLSIRGGRWGSYLGTAPAVRSCPAAKTKAGPIGVGGGKRSQAFDAQCRRIVVLQIHLYRLLRVAVTTHNVTAVLNRAQHHVRGIADSQLGGRNRQLWLWRRQPNRGKLRDSECGKVIRTVSSAPTDLPSAIARTDSVRSINSLASS